MHTCFVLRKSADANVQMTDFVTNNAVDIILGQDPHLVDREQCKLVCCGHHKTFFYIKVIH